MFLKVAPSRSIEDPVVRATGCSRAYYLGFLKPGRAAADRPFSATAEAALTTWLCFGIDPQLNHRKHADDMGNHAGNIHGIPTFSNRSAISEVKISISVCSFLELAEFSI